MLLIRRFVWPKDFTKAPVVAVDRGEDTGNMVDNISQAYPNAHFVELEVLFHRC